MNTDDLKQVIRNTPHPRAPGNAFQPTCVFLLLFEKKGPHILAIQKTDTNGYAWRNQVALPGGHMDEKDLSSIETAFRELEEEVSITKKQVDLIGSMGHFQTINQKDLEVFTGLWDKKGTVRFDSYEIARVLEIPLANLVKTHDENAYHGRIPSVHELVYPFGDVVIWGVTGRIIHYFIELLYPMLKEV